MIILMTNTNLNQINFIKQIKDRANIYKRLNQDWKQNLERPADAIPPEKLLKLCRDFNKGLKGMDETGQAEKD